METSQLYSPKKIVKVLVQFGQFIHYDIYQKGLYNIQCRLFARDPNHKHPVRVDAYPVTFLADEESISHEDPKDRPFPPSGSRRLKCYQDHRLCPWKCKVLSNSVTSSSSLNIASSNPSDPEIMDIYISETFRVTHKMEEHALFSGVVFRLEVDDNQYSVKTSEVSGSQLRDYEDAFLEVSLCFNSDFGCKKEEIVPIRTRLIRIRNVFPSSNFSKPALFHYHNVEFDDAFFSSLDLLVSVAHIGYQIPKRPVVDSLNQSQPAPTAPPKKTFWSWVTKKFGWFSSVDPKGADKESTYAAVSSSAPNSCHPNQFPAEMLRIETMLDNLISLQSIINQMVYDFSLAHPDLVMTDGYVFDSVYQVLHNEEGGSKNDRPISLEMKQEMYKSITEMIKTRIKSLQSSEKAREVLDDVATSISDLNAKIWRSFIADMALLSPERVQSIRVIWTRIKNAKLSEYIFSRQEMGTHTRKLQEKVQKSIQQHFPYDILVDDEADTTPLFIEYHSPVESPSVKFSRTESQLASVNASLLPSIEGSFVVEGGIHTQRSSFIGFPSNVILSKDDESVRALFSKSTFDDQASVLSTFMPGIYIRDIETNIEKAKRREKKPHLIIFVHGLMGSSFDFRQYQNRMMKQMLHMGVDRPEHVYLISKSNEEDTLESIEKQGLKLAIEIDTFIKEQQIQLERISLGGVIARYAMTTKLLDPLKKQFYQFISYGSPHLSLMFYSHSLINSFLGIYQTIQKSRCIDQLHLKDSSDPRKSLLYKLAHDNSLSHFSIVRFFGSKQDKYVPFPSAMLLEDFAKQNSGTSSTNSNARSLSILNYKQSLPPIPSSKVSSKSPDLVYQEMLMAMSKTLESAALVEKFEIAFPDSSPSSRDLLGRKGHVAMVEDSRLLELALLTNRMHM